MANTIKKVYRGQKGKMEVERKTVPTAARRLCAHKKKKTKEKKRVQVSMDDRMWQCVQKRYTPLLLEKSSFGDNTAFFCALQNQLHNDTVCLLLCNAKGGRKSALPCGARMLYCDRQSALCTSGSCEG